MLVCTSVYDASNIHVWGSQACLGTGSSALTRKWTAALARSLPICKLRNRFSLTRSLALSLSLSHTHTHAPPPLPLSLSPSFIFVHSLHPPVPYSFCDMITGHPPGHGYNNFVTQQTLQYRSAHKSPPPPCTLPCIAWGLGC